MAAIRSRNTGPELYVRRRLHAAGYRFRLHRADLPGKPDLVFPRHRVVVFVHGCFWHGHICREARRPRSNLNYWLPKIEKNIARDRASAISLRKSGWKVIIVRECALDQGIERAIRGLKRSSVRSIA